MEPKTSYHIGAPPSQEKASGVSVKTHTRLLFSFSFFFIYFYFFTCAY